MLNVCVRTEMKRNGTAQHVMKNGKEECLCEKVKEKKWGSCNITPLVALKSPTSVICIVIEIVVVVEILVEGRLMVFKLGVFSILPLLQLGVEVPSLRLCLEEFAPIQFRAEGGEMTGGVPGAYTAEVAVAINLAMPFLVTVAANKIRVVNSVAISEAFLGRGAFTGASILGNLYSSRDDGGCFFNDGGSKGNWSSGGGEWSGCALVRRGMTMGKPKGIGN